MDFSTASEEGLMIGIFQAGYNAGVASAKGEGTLRIIEISAQGSEFRVELLRRFEELKKQLWTAQWSGG